MSEFLGSAERERAKNLPPSCIACVGERLLAAEVVYADVDEDWELYGDHSEVLIEHERTTMPDGTTYVKEIEGISYSSGGHEIGWELTSCREVKVDCRPSQCDLTKK